MASIKIVLQAYVSPPPTGGIAWPNILNTVAEAQARSFETKLKMLHGFVPLVFAGFFGLTFLCVRRFKQMIPMAPMIALGIWSLVGPNRFVMYLAPLVGVGTGVLLEILVNYVAKKAGLRRPLASIMTILLMFALFFSTVAYTGFYVHAGPIIPASMVKSLLDIKRIVPQHSAMFTPYWEYGYPLMEIGDFATYHDGGLQGGIRTTLISKVMLSDNQKDMVSLISYLNDYGFNPLIKQIQNEKLSGKNLLKRVTDYPPIFKGDKVYVLYLEDMLSKLSAMSYFGAWDFEHNKSTNMDYFELKCFSLTDNVMRCSDGTIDLNKGFMNDGSSDIPLRAALFVNNGYVVERKDYERGDGYYLEILMKDDKVYQILVADEALFKTNFNQQYLLGNYDRQYFEEIYNNFPEARVLKVKKAISDDLKQ
jgi:dolichyl-diphosphooligosaccharide--protein glycosyltransferase